MELELVLHPLVGQCFYFLPAEKKVLKFNKKKPMLKKNVYVIIDNLLCV